MRVKGRRDGPDIETISKTPTGRGTAARNTSGGSRHMRPGIRGTRSGVPLFVCCSRCFRWSRCFRRSQSPPRRLCPEWMLINIETICFSLICCFAWYFLYDSAMLMDTYIQHKCLHACSATPLPLQDLTPPIKSRERLKHLNHLKHLDHQTKRATPDHVP